MTARKKTAAAKDEPEAPKAPEKVFFIASAHTSGTKTESGATFSFTPLMKVKMTRPDAEALVSEGLGSIQGD